MVLVMGCRGVKDKSCELIVFCPSTFHETVTSLYVLDKISGR